MTNNIPLPRLLNVYGETERRISPVSVSVNLEMTPLSYASMQLPQDENVPARSYVELYTVMGSAGIYRVRSPQDAYGTDLTTAELEHAIVEVGDYIILDEYKEMMAASTAMQTVFSHYRGNKWQLGSVTALGSGQIALQAGYNRVLEAMLAILEQKPDCMMSFDFTTSPWTVNFVAKGTTVAAEGRLSRNLSSAKVTYDDTELCTRAYYEYQTTDGEGDVDSVWAYIDADTMSTYGLIEREVQTGSDYTADEAYRVASEYISKHKNPRVSIETSLDELSCITGETLDAFEIGKLCRLALPDYGVVIEEHITGLSFPDVYGNPRSINARLAEKEDTAITFLHDLDAKGGTIGGGGGGGRRNDDIWKEFRTRIEQDDYHIGLISEHVDRNNEILQAAGIDIDSQTGVLIYHDDVENGLGARFLVNAEAIASEVTRAGEAEVELRSSITQTASNIMSEVENTVSGIHSVINQTANNIMIEVGRKNSVYSQWDNPSQSQNAQEGDIWIKTNGIRTYGKAGEYTWDTLGGYAWADFYGAEIYVLDENGNWVLAGGDQLQNISRTLIDQTDDRIALITDGMSGDYAEFIVELGRIHSRVTDVENGLSSTIEQTASMIRTAVWTANSEMYSEIMQTQSMIRSEVANTESNIRSTITQTASGIWTEVGRKSTVFTQWGSPSGTKKDGDIWIKDSNIRTWLNMETKTWNALSEYKWSDFYGSIHYVWENGAWKEMASQQLENITHSVQEVTDERISNLVEDMAGNYSEFIQEKGQIRSTVRNLSEDLGSSIRQTASEIRSDVWAANSSIYSSITQTASQIRLEVASTKSSLSSSITQTATQIRSEVNAAKSSIYSSITQNSDKIALVVGSNGIKEASIVAAINNGASSVVISANHVQLDGYVSATNFSTVLANLSSAHIQRLYVDSNIYGPNGNSIYTLGLMGISLSSSGNTYTLKQTTLNGTETTIGTFSRAVSSWGIGGGGGNVNVTAYPQNQSKSVSVSLDGPANIYSNGSYTYKVDYFNLDGDEVPTGYEKTVNVSVSSPSPSNARVSSSASGTSLGALSGASPGKHILFNLGSSVYDILLT